MNDIDLMGQLGDLKEIDYRNTLAIELLRVRNFLKNHIILIICHWSS
jgi:hypothetical protein